MRQISLVLVVLSVLSGCTTTNYIDNGLNSLVGQHEDVAIEVLGYPDNLYQLDEASVFVWDKNYNGTLYMSDATRVTYIGLTPVYSVNASYDFPVYYNCSIKLIVEDDRVKSWEFNGKVRRCDTYSDKLKNYVESLGGEKQQAE